MDGREVGKIEMSKECQRCKEKVTVILGNKQTKTVKCHMCGTSHDFFGSTHDYMIGTCACSELVKLGVSEQTRSCDEWCGGR